MTSHFRAIAIAIALAASTAVYAQSGASTPQGGNNPIARGEDIFTNPFNRGQPSTFGRGGLDETGIGRNAPRRNTQVTPVPEPSQWAMLAAGLALVGFIVRRNSRKSRDAS